MAEYEITAPDGSVYRVTPPAGVSKQQALDRFRSKYTAGKMKEKSSAAVRKTDSAPSQLSFGLQGDEELSYRGQFLPLGRTESGKIVPALPQAFQDAATMTKKAVETGDIDPGAAVGAGLAFSPGGVAARGPAKSLIPGKDPYKPEIMTAEQIGTAKTEAYAASKAAGVAASPAPFEAMVRSLPPVLAEAGYDEELTPWAGKLMKRLARDAALGQPKTLTELDMYRKLARAAQESATNKTDKALANIVKEKIDGFIEGLDDKDLVTDAEKIGDAAVRLKDGRVFTGKNHSDAIDAAIKATGGGVEFAQGGQGLFQTSKGRIISYQEAVNLPEGGRREEGIAALKQGRELALREIKAEEIDDIMKNAVIDAGAQNAAGIENAWRAGFARLAKNKDKMRRYTPEEQEALMAASTTGAMQKGLVNLGKLSPTAGAFGAFLATLAAEGIVGGGAGTAGMGAAAAAAIPASAIGLVARYAATKIRDKSVNILGELVKGGRPISDYRVQQAMRGRSVGADVRRGGLMPGSGLLPQQRPDQSGFAPAIPAFNPLINPNQV